LVSKHNLSAGLELCRKYNLSLGAYCKFLGYGYRSLGSLTKRLWSLPGRLRNYIVAYHSESMPGFKGFLPWLTMRSLSTSYKTTEARVRSALESLLQVDKQELLGRISQIELELNPVYDPERFEEFGHVITGDSSPGRFPKHPGIRTMSNDVMWHLDRVVYGDVFQQALRDIGLLRTKVTALGTDLSSSLPELWSAVREIERLIGALPRTTTLTATPNESKLGEGVKEVVRWARLSRPFRSTTMG
jgi:hypothetical protein